MSSQLPSEQSFMTSPNSGYRSQLARQEREQFDRDLRLKELEPTKAPTRPDPMAGTIQDRRTTVRQDAEQRQLQANIRRMEDEVNSEVIVHTRRSSSGSAGTLVSDPQAQYIGQPKLGTQYLPTVQPTPAVQEGPRPLTKKQLCRKTCSCGLTVCRMYGNIRN
jgi:hypothetical protein